MSTVDVNALIYKNESPLFVIHLVLALIFWLALIIGTKGVALIYLVFLFIGYLFAQSGRIAWIKGNGVKMGHGQYFDLYERYLQCCNILGFTSYPDVYLINGQGVLNAFATRFLGCNFVVLNSNIVDAVSDNPEAIKFYMGHELGHLQRKHIQWGAFIAPVSILPLLGSAYSRSREYTCDQFGSACCNQSQSALQGLTALAAGEKRWASLNITDYLNQIKETGGFWMSLHELIADYPWLVKRAARIENTEYDFPSRNLFAWLFACFIPRLGSATGGLVVIAIIGIMASSKIPIFKENTARTHLDDLERAKVISTIPKSAPVVSTEVRRPVVVNVNSATLEELAALPRVSENIAQAIIDGRPYSSADDLLRVYGIGPKTLENIRPFVRVK